MPIPTSSTASRRRRLTTTVGGALSVLLATSFITAGPGHASPGPAPASTTLTRIGDVHTDAIATFVEDGRLVLDSKADTPSVGTRYSNDSIFFHVDDQSRVDTWPESAPGFVAPIGSTVWLAPQSPAPNQLWPGISTESVPRGTLVNDETTLTLQAVEGPGDVELWQTSGTDAPSRLWSSDQDIKSFTRGNVHLHANWAFTQPGTYRMKVRADAVLRATDAAVTDTATYTFVVGGEPQDVDTTTTLKASATSVAAGEAVTLTSTVSPAGVDGAVEFRDGSTVLGHDDINGSGVAQLDNPQLASGSHSITAVFVPSIENYANTSTSSPVTVTATDSSGVPFSVRGMAASYEPGSTMTLQAVGVTPTANQEIRWRMRYQGTGTTSVHAPVESALTYSQQVDAKHDDTEIQAMLYDNDAQVTLSETAWVPVDVAHLNGQPTIEQVGTAADPLYPGDPFAYRLTERPLEDGETIVWGFSPYAGNYGPQLASTRWPATYPSEDKSSIRLTSRYNPVTNGRYAQPLVATIMRDGLAVSRTALTYINTARRELNVSGARTLYREGGRVLLDATTYPDRAGDDLSYTWTFTKTVDGTTTTDVWGAANQPTAALEGPALDKARHDGGSLTLTLFNHGVQAQTAAVIPIRVTDDLNNQILEFSALAEHYHQGNSVALRLTADPEPLDGDTLAWQWKWPGGEWAPMPGVKDDVWETTAEQALHGVQVRAVLTWADPTREPLIAAARTVQVDDHGAAARQTPTVSGAAAYTDGQTVTLTRELPDNGKTLLTSHQWQRQLAGSDEWQPVAGATGAELSFPARSAEDGARYRVSIMKPTGEVAYGPSRAVQVAVSEAPVAPPELSPAATRISASKATQTYGRTSRLSIAVSPAATGTVSVTAGSKTVSAQLSGSRAEIELPAKSLAPGTRSVTVSYAGVAGTYAPSSRTIRVTVRKARPTIRIKASASAVKSGGTAKFVVTATAAGVRPTGRVTVRVAGTSKTVRLNKWGKAVVRVKIGKRARAGSRTVSARYSGSRHVAAAKAPSIKVRVTR